MAEAKVKLSADDKSGGAWASFIGSAQKAEGQLNRVAGASALFSKASAVVAAGLSAAVFTARINDTIEYADQLNKLSQRTGLAASTLSQWQYVANMANVSNETFTKGLRELNKSIAEALAGDKNKIASFKAVGVSTADLGKGTEAVMFKMADAYATAKDGSGKLANASGLLGAKVGDELIPVLNQGSDAIRKMKEEADKLGLTISDEFAAQAEEFNDNLARLKKSSDALYVSLASDLVKGLGDAAKAMADAAVEGGKFAGILAGVQTLLTGTDRYKNDKALVELTERKLVLEGKLARMESQRSVRQPNEAVIERARDELGQVDAEIKTTLAYRKVLDESDARAKAAADGRAKAKAAGEIAPTNGAAADAAFNRGIDAQVEALKARSKVVQDLAKRDADTLESEFKRGIRNEQDFIETAAQSDINALGAQRAALLEQLALVQKKSDSEKEAASVRGQISEIDAKMQSRGVKYQNDYLEALYKRAKASDAVIMAQQEEANQEKSAAELEADKRYRAIEESVRAYGRSIDAANEQTGFELSLMGRTERARAIAIEQHRIEIGLRDQERKIDEADITDDQKTEQKLRARAAAARELAAAEGKVTLEEWQKTNDSINGSLTDALLRGFEKGKDAAENFRDTVSNMFRTLILRPIISGVLSPISGAISSGVGSIVGGSGVGGIAGSIGTSIAGSQLGQALGLPSLFGGGAAGASSIAMTNAIGGGMASVAEATAINSAIASSAGGLTAALAAVPGWGWAALGAATLLGGSGMFGKGGGPKVSGYYGPGVETLADNTMGAGLGATLSAYQAQANDVVKLLGGSSQIGLGLAVSTDPRGTAPTILQNAAVVNGSSVHFRQDANVGRDDESLKAAIETQAKEAFLFALQGSDAKGALVDWLRRTDIMTDLNAVFTRVQTALTQRAALEQRLFDLTATDLDKLNKTREAERKAIDDTNKLLLEQVYATEDLSTAGANLRTAYDQESQSRQASVESLRGAAKALRDYRDQVLLNDDSILSSTSRLGEAERQFNDTLGKAQGGDLGALSDLKDASGNYLAALKAGAADRTEYAIGAARVLAALTMTASSSDAKATIEEQLLATAKDQLAAFGLLSANVLTFAQALTAYLSAKDAVAAAKAAVDADAAAHATPAAIAAAVAAAPTAASPVDYGYSYPMSDGFATGGAFLGSGVVLRPTSFDRDEMAEAGPEAILPLVNVGGSLGVRAAGGAGNGEAAAIMREVLSELRDLRRDARTGDSAMVASLVSIDAKLKKFDNVGPEYQAA